MGVAAVCSHWDFGLLRLIVLIWVFFLVVFIYLLAWLALGC